MEKKKPRGKNIEAVQKSLNIPYFTPPLFFLIP